MGSRSMGQKGFKRVYPWAQLIFKALGGFPTSSRYLAPLELNQFPPVRSFWAK